ncbi:hypothetical protein [Micromonospora sp. CPCC 206061]|uniref:hypothetical protein n=1 Tax=Micromonospora sp. CPCC 206061 TaxID=3122410 RepID=UPI002FF0F4E4
MIRFWTYHLTDSELTERVVRYAAPDVIAVQGLPGQSQDRAEAALLRLADATGLVCRLGRDHTGPVAAVRGGHDLAVGIMWQREVWADRLDMRVYTGPEWWHALLLVELLVEDRWVWHGSYHAPPAEGGRRRPNEAIQVVTAMQRACPGLIGGDWDNEYHYLDRHGLWLANPSPGAVLLNPHDGVDRAAASILCGGHLYDAAVKLGPRRPVTTGHWPGAEDGYRAADSVMATADAVDAIRERLILHTDEARRASGHTPTGVLYDPRAIHTAPPHHQPSTIDVVA